MTTYNYVNLPLESDYYYSYSVVLEDNSYVLEIQYNDYCDTWFLSVFTEDQELIVAGLALVPGYPIGQDYVIPNLSGFFWLYPIPNITTEKYKEDPEVLSQYYTLKYIYDLIV